MAEIRLSKLTSTIKGQIWSIIGILIGKFSILLNSYKLEVHDVIFTDFKKIVSAKKPEIKALQGILKGYIYLLDDPHLKANDIEELYHYVKSLIHPLEDANTIKINKLALKIISEHGKVFTQQLQRESIELFDLVFELCNHKNYELKMCANEAIEKICMHISDCLLEKNTLHKDVFKYLLRKIEEVLEKRTQYIMINTAISLIGIFSDAIVRFMGKNILMKYLEELIVICDKDILYSIGKDSYRQAKQMNYDSNSSAYSDPSSKYKPSKNIKNILYTQRQYFSILDSYANIISNLDEISELAIKHFYNILIVGFSIHSKFYYKYKERLCSSIANIIVNMVKHKNFFWSFIRKVIKNGFVESIKMTTDMVFKENVEEERINTSIDFWIMLLTRDKIFTEFTINKFFDQLMNEIFTLIDSLNVSYTEKVTDGNNIYYEANDSDDLEIFLNTSRFLSGFIDKLKTNNRLIRHFSNWIIVALKKYMSIANDNMRIAQCYVVLSSVMKFCEEINLFDDKRNGILINNNININSNSENPSSNNNVLQMITADDIKEFKTEFYSFNMNLVKRLEIFQDDLLLNAIELLLSIPTSLINYIYVQNNIINISILKNLYKKVFEIGFTDIRYSELAINSLKKLIDDNKEKKNEEILNDILPLFGEYLLEYEKIKKSFIYSKEDNKNEKIERYNKVQDMMLDIIGSIGGNGHKIIKEDDSYNYENGEKDKTAVVNILNKKKIIYQLPLFNKKYNVYFDLLLSKICDMIFNSMAKDKKFISAELLHSLIIYIIGKGDAEMDHSLIYLLRKILYLSCDLEKGISKIYETLLFQLIHWISKDAKSNKNILQMLDIIIECTSNHKNLKLREISSECLSEYIKWFIKQNIDVKSIKEKSHTLKYLIRKIESNSLHPDSFKRFGAILCFEKILIHIIKNKYLADKFLLEIFYYIIATIKICHTNLDLNEFIFKHGVNSVNIIIKGIIQNFDNLNKPNYKRSHFASLKDILKHLYSNIMSNDIEANYVVQQSYLSIFKLISRNAKKEENLEKYWTKENNWPKLKMEYLNSNNNNVYYFYQEIAEYQFISFLIDKKILGLKDIKFKYMNFALDKLFNRLVFLLKKIKRFRNKKEKENELRLLKTCFIYLINILKSDIQLSTPFILDLINGNTKNKNDNILYILFDIVQSLKETDKTLFILKKYENEIRTFMQSIQIFTEVFLNVNSKYFFEHIENYLLEKCYLFFQFDKLKENGLDKAKAIEMMDIDEILNIKREPEHNESDEEGGEENEKEEKSKLSDEVQIKKIINNKYIIDYFFWLITHRLICNNFSQKFTDIIYNNCIFLITNTSPNTLLLMRNYINFLFLNAFDKLSELLLKDQHYFDIIADIFLENITNDLKYKFILQKDENCVKNFIISNCKSSNYINTIFILYERCSTDSKKNLIKLISEAYLTNITLFNNQDAIVNQLKIATMIYINITIKNLDVDQLKIDKNIYEIGLDIIDMYINEKQINIIKEVLNLLGIIVKISSFSSFESSNSNSTDSNDLFNKIKNKYTIIQSRYFPINTKCLVPNSKEWNEFQLIFDCLLSTFRTVKSFSFLEILFPILREDKTEYSKKVKISINEYLKTIMSYSDKGLKEIQKSIDIFLNQNMDRKPRDNIRISLMKIITFKYIKKISLEKEGIDILCDLFYKYYEKMKNLIIENKKILGNSPTQSSYEEKFVAILEITIIYKFINLIFDHINVDAFKNNIHRKICGPNTKGNEITKELIGQLHDSKRREINGSKDIAEKVQFSEYNQENKTEYIQIVFNNYYCSAYNCLCSLIKLTQTKVEVYNNFLFSTFRDKGDKLFDLLISPDFKYEFPIETNFYIKQINKSENGNRNSNNNDNKEENNGDNNNAVDNKEKNKLLIDSLVSDSFFHDAYGATIKKSLAFTQNNFDMSFLAQIKNGINLNFTTGNTNEKISELISSNNSLKIEEDYVNKHPIMNSMVIILTHMHNLFFNNMNISVNPKRNANITSLLVTKMPTHLQLLLNEMNRDNLSLNQKIFFIKVILNKIDIFEMYMDNFIPFLINFVILEKSKCGKGFNYFFRDIATTILACKDLKLEVNKGNIDMMSNYINTLIKISGDNKNIIFRTNLKIINDLMNKFRYLIYLDHGTIQSMLKFDSSKPGAHIWQVSAIQVLASAIEYDIPIGDDLLYNNNNENKNKKFITSFEANKEICVYLLKLCSNNKTPVQNAAIELISKILNFYAENETVENENDNESQSHSPFDMNSNNNNNANDQAESKLNKNKFYVAMFKKLSDMSISNTDKVAVNTIFRAGIQYPMFIANKEIFTWSLNLLRKVTNKQRNLIFNTLSNFMVDIVDRIVNKSSKNLVSDNLYINDIYNTLYQLRNQIFIDPDDELINNLVNIMNQFIIIADKKYMNVLQIIISNIQNCLKSKEHQTKFTYYSFLVDCFIKSSQFDNDFAIFVLNKIIINFNNENNKELSQIFIEFFNNGNDNKIPNNPVDRLIYLLRNLSDETIQKEGDLIQIISKSILVLSYSSADYFLLIYEKGLEECVYKDLNINTTGYYLNRSQPIAPSVMHRNTMDETYETLVKASIDGYNNNQITGGGFIQATIDGNTNPNLLNTFNQLLNNSVNDFLFTNTLASSQAQTNTNLVSNNTSMDIIPEESETKSNFSFDRNKNINRTNNNAKSGKGNIKTLSMSQREINLTQYSSLINSTVNYPSMNEKSNKNVNFGFTHGEAFKVPYPVNKNKKKESKLRNVWAENELTYQPVDESQSNLIRFVPEGVSKNSSNFNNKNQEQNKNELLMYKWINRQENNQKHQIKLLRRYREGDLPDIQIRNKDILDPLMAVCNNNSEISGELILEIIISIYKEAIYQDKNKELENIIEEILKKNIIRNYLTISSIHRLIITFMKINSDYIPSLEVIKLSGLVSKNYHSSILIFEACVENLKSGAFLDDEDDTDNSKSKRNMRKRIVKKSLSNNEDTEEDVNLLSQSNNIARNDIIINKKTKVIWIYLLQFYSKLKIKDTQIGLIQNFSLNSDLFMKEGNNFLSHLSDLLTHSNESVKYNIERTNLLQATFDMLPETLGKDYNIEIIEAMKSKYNKNIFNDSSLKEVIEDFALTSCADLGQWAQINKYLTNNENNENIINTNIEIESENNNGDKKENKNINEIRTEELIQSNIFNLNENGDNLLINKQLDTILSTLDEVSLNNYSYYIALHHAKNKDFDKSYLYYQKSKSNLYNNWLSLGEYSNTDLKHEIIKKIQMIYELGEFLNFIRGTSATNPNLGPSINHEFILSEQGSQNLKGLFSRWSSRWPNYLYDEPSAYEKIYKSREVILNIMNSHISNYEQIVSSNHILESFPIKEKAEIGINLYKKKMLDFADRVFKIALNERKNPAYENSFIGYPYMKNKYKMIHYEIDNNISVLNDNNSWDKKFSNFMKVLQSQINKTEANNIEIKNKLNNLKLKILLDISSLKLGPNLNDIDLNTNPEIFSDKNINDLITSFKTARESFNTIQKNINEKEDISNYLKILRPMIFYCDKIIRNFQDNEENDPLFFTKQNISEFYNNICKTYMELTLKGLSYEDKKLIKIIPKLLELLSRNINILESIFSKYSSFIDISYYLCWQSQLMSYINSPSMSKLLFPIIQQILKKQPQTLFYTFTTQEKYSSIFNRVSSIINNSNKNNLIKEEENQNTELFNYINKFYSDYHSLNALVEAFDSLTNPEHRIKFWLNQISNIVLNHKNEVNSNIELITEEINIIKDIINQLTYDVITPTKKYIESKLGTYNRKFGESFKDLINNTVNLTKIKDILLNRSVEGQDKQKLFFNLVQPLNQSLSKSDEKLPEGIEKLSTFSEWLSQYECNDFTDPKKYIILPMSNNNNLNNYSNDSVKINSFDQHLLILSSIRKPKKIKIFGNNEKSYDYLVKGGEDLRLDQRIQEVFKVMNEILIKNSNCAKKKLKLNTFVVVPITQKLGIIEWISDTQSLYKVIKYSMENLIDEYTTQYQSTLNIDSLDKPPEKKVWELHKSPQYLARIEWYNKKFPKITNILQQSFGALLIQNNEEIIRSFRKIENMMPSYVLQKSLMHYLLTPEEILAQRISFIRNYAAICISGYILGIGDRHLDNFLINVNNSEIVAIDFGVAFGQGLNQLIPELVPYRLTRQLCNVLSPFGIKGIIRQTMIDVLSAYKFGKDYILDYCEVFVKEPLLEWMQKNQNINNTNDIENYFEQDKNKWVPMLKYNTVKNKLSGVNPLFILRNEMNESEKIHEKSKDIINNIIMGALSSLRFKCKEQRKVEVDLQVDLLNEQATDPNLLGRMWIGWSAFI